MTWLRRQPNLRLNILVALATALRMKPTKYLEEILAEQHSLERATLKQKRQNAVKLTRQIARG